MIKTKRLSGFKIGLYTGLIGGIILAFLSHDPFKLYFLGGYLLIITLGFTVFSSIYIYRKEERNSILFMKKVQVGLGAYLVTIISSTVYKILVGQFNLKNNLEENILLVLTHLGFGIFLSTLFSICFKGQRNFKNNSPNHT